MIPIIVMIVSFLFDGILTNFLPYLVNDLTYFTPMFTVTCIFLIYPFYRKQEKKYYLILFGLGFLYDLFYTNLLFFNGSLFVILGFTSYYFHKNFGFGYIKNIIFIIILISLYEVLSVLFLMIYRMVPITYMDVLYKISHSLILNIIYGNVIYFIIKIIPKKYKKISIN